MRSGILHRLIHRRALLGLGHGMIIGSAQAASVLGFSMRKTYSAVLILLESWQTSIALDLNTAHMHPWDHA